MFPDNGKSKKNTTTVGSDEDKVSDQAPDVQDMGTSIDITTNLKTTPPASDGANKDLLEIKKKALHQLSDSVDILEQPPEQMFRTVMLIIQETDNSSMLNKAYSIASQIEDRKSRAEALLTVVNEINYFTSK